MSKPFLAFLLSLWLLACDSPAQRDTPIKIDLKSGHKDLLLGMPLQTVQRKTALTLVSHTPCRATKVYQIPSGPYLTMGTSRFQRVELEFIDDILVKTILWKEAGGETTRLVQAYRTVWDVPLRVKTQTVEGQRRRVSEWLGETNYVTITETERVETRIEYGSYRGVQKSRQAQRTCAQRSPV